MFTLFIAPMIIHIGAFYNITMYTIAYTIYTNYTAKFDFKTV